MAKTEKFYLFSFSPGQMMSWGIDKGDTNGRGLFHARFSSAGSIFAKTYPDHGLVEGRPPQLIYGEYLPPEYAAKLKNPIPAGNINAKNRGKLPADMAALGDGSFGHSPVVTGRLKAVIEAMEPGKHQFFPVSFVNADLDPPVPVWTDTDWYYFNLLNWVAPDRLFNLEAMGELIEVKNVPDVYGRVGRRAFYFPGEQRLNIVRRSFLESNAGRRKLFVSTKYMEDITLNIYSINPHFYCTHEMRLAFKEAGLKGGHFTELKVI